MDLGPEIRPQAVYRRIALQKDNQRRLLLLLKLLYEQTDETHFVSGADILRYWEDAGIRANRKNVYGDVQLLLDAGHDIIRVKSKQNRYFIGSRIFELPELKLLADAVASSHLVTEKKSAALLQKLGRLTSVHNAGHLNRPVYMEGTTKPDNEAIYSQTKAPETVIQEVEEKETATTTPESDTAKILELLKNPETAALLKQIVSAL